eukprot:5303279-Amphidinium_carterae.1
MDEGFYDSPLPLHDAKRNLFVRPPTLFAQEGFFHTCRWGWGVRLARALGTAACVRTPSIGGHGIACVGLGTHGITSAPQLNADGITFAVSAPRARLSMASAFASLSPLIAASMRLGWPRLLAPTPGHQAVDSGSFSPQVSSGCSRGFAGGTDSRS